MTPPKYKLGQHVWLNLVGNIHFGVIKSIKSMAKWPSLGYNYEYLIRYDGSDEQDYLPETTIGGATGKIVKYK